MIVNAAQHSMQRTCGNRTAKMAFFVALGYIRFVGESRPSSRG